MHFILQIIQNFYVTYLVFVHAILAIIEPSIHQDGPLLLLCLHGIFHIKPLLLVKHKAVSVALMNNYYLAAHHVTPFSLLRLYALPLKQLPNTTEGQFYNCLYLV